MKKLIITADDYGVFPAINRAVMDAVKEKKINSVSVLANFDGDEHYPGSVKNLEQLIHETGDTADIGCHLTITSGRPITGDKMSFACDRDGNFLSYTEFNNFQNEDELNALKTELTEQVNRLNNAIPGFKVKHLTNHHNSLTLFPYHFKVYMDVARDFGIPMRSTAIEPERRQNVYLRFLNFKLRDDIHKEERQVIMDFNAMITQYFKDHANGIKAPEYMDSRNYGPIGLLPFANLFGGIVKQKRKKLDNLFESFNARNEESLELLLHLAKPDGRSVDLSKDLPYTGIDRKYFDSRTLEFKAIMNYDFDNLQNIQKINWAALS